MGKRNELRVTLASVLITALLVGAGFGWARSRLSRAVNPMPISGNQGNGGDRADAADNPTLKADGTSGASVMPGTVSQAKQKGLNALAEGDYAKAKVELSAALAEKRNDPEALIYLNNAKIGRNSAHTIAISVPASLYSNPTLEMLRGVAQAQTEINDQLGINGVPLKVLIVNDAGSPEKATQLARHLVKNKDVLGVIGHYASDTTLEAAKIYESGKLPVISPTSTAMAIADAGDYVFRTVPSDRLAAATLARYTYNHIKKKRAVVFFDSENTYSRSVKSEFTTEFLSDGGEVVLEYDTAEPGFNPGAALQAAQQSKADVLMLGVSLSSVDVPAQILAVNKGKLPVVASDSLYSPRILNVGQENAAGVVVAVPWHAHNHERSDFVARARSLWGGDVNWRTVTTYDAVMALAGGMAIEPSRNGIASAMTDNTFSAAGATSQVKFFSTGDRNQSFQLVTIAASDRASSGYEFVPLLKKDKP